MWIEDEQQLTLVAYQQVRRIFVRARRRLFVTLGLALVVAAALFAVQVRRPKMYEAQVGLLITEGAFTADGSPRPRGELRGLISDVIFVTARLEALIIKHDLVKKLGGANQADTAARVRRLIEVNTWNDDFVGYRQSDDRPRSARVTIAFSAPDPALALAVARDLGELVAETQTARESEGAAARLAGLRMIAENAAARASSHNARLEREREKEDALSQPAGPLDPRLQHLAHVARAAGDDSRAAAADLFNAEIQARELRATARLVQIVDPGVPLWHTASRSSRLTRQAVLSLVVAAFISTVLVGAFDPAVLDEHDLYRARLRCLGKVPVCSGRSSRTEV
jgi:hypothetical protein